MHTTVRRKLTTALAAILLPVAALLPSSPASAKAKQPPPVLSSTEIAHWGAYFDGTGSGTDRTLSPAGTAIPDTTPGARVVQVASSNSTQYALMSDGTVWAWGMGGNGELGDGQTVNNFTTTAVQVQFPQGVQIASLPTDAMPYDTGLAIDTNGNAWGWGLNKGGQLCIGSQAQQDEPAELGLPSPVTLGAGADEHTVWDADGTIVGCGANTDGEGGWGTAGGPDRTSPVTITSGLGVTALTASMMNEGMIRGGQYLDWGFNASGQAGNGTTKNADAPVAPALPDPSPVVQAAQGGSDSANGQVMVLLADGAVYAWGNNTWDQTREAAGPNATAPVSLLLPAGVSFTSVASGGGTNYGITPAGAVYAWGCGSAGQIGDGSTVTQPGPVQVMSGASFISSTANDVVVG